MAIKKKEINPGGVQGTGKGIVNVNSKDFKGLQKAILEHSQNQEPQERIKIRLLSLKYQMESYVKEKTPDQLVRSGEFLKEHLQAIGIKNKEFAKYLGIEESNLSSILKGRRKINIDLALKLGELFRISPTIWLLIQSKNDLLNVDSDKIQGYKKYNLEDLLKKVG